LAGVFLIELEKFMSNSHHEKFRLRYGQWSVVTGASSGIGQAIAIELASRGLNLVLVARRETELRQLAAQLETDLKIQTRVMACDLSELAAMDRVKTETAGLEIGSFIAAVGFGTSGDFIDANMDDEISMLDVNCRAAMILASHFGKKFVERGRGGMVLFGSLVGFQGTPHAAHYAATKAYVQNLGEALHHEFKAKGVDVLVAAPGPVHSGFAQRARMVMGAADKPEVVASAIVNALGKKMTVTPGPVGKLLTWSLMTAPRSLRVRIMGKIMGGMTKK
jgi:uncharacterized protein